MKLAGLAFPRNHAFRSLSDEELAFVQLAKRDTITLPANRDLVRTGEVGGPVLLLVEGWAYRYRRLDEDRRQIFEFLLPGELAGLQSALLGMIDHSIRSLTPVRVCRFDGRRIDELHRDHPRLALAVAKLLAENGRRVDRRLALLGRCTAVQRIAALLLEIHERCNGTDGRCPFPLRRQHMADACGLTGAHVNRTLNRLRRDGIAWLENNSLVVPDRAKLNDCAGLVVWSRPTIG